MKVYIGKYRKWIGPYQIADWLRCIGVSKEKCREIGEWLSKTWVSKLCHWIDSKKKRKIKIRIDDYDIWAMHSTLAYIILPMLKKLKATHHGAGWIDDEDVPENIRRTAAPQVEKWESDIFFENRWDYVIDEMIFAFEHIHSDFECDRFDKKIVERVDQGLKLFGKYFRALWD